MKRYAIFGRGAEIKENAKGEWVRYADVAKLLPQTEPARPVLVEPEKNEPEISIDS